MNKQKIYKEAMALLKYAQGLLLAARAKHEQHVALMAPKKAA